MNEMALRCRGKDINTDDWVFGNLILGRHALIVTDDAKDTMLISNKSRCSVWVKEVNKDTLGQCTGTIAQVGMSEDPEEYDDVYEGDVLIIKYKGYDIAGLVAATRGTFVLISAKVIEEGGCMLLNKLLKPDTDIGELDALLLGNVVDNPELYEFCGFDTYYLKLTDMKTGDTYYTETQCLSDEKTLCDQYRLEGYIAEVVSESEYSFNTSK